MKPQVPPGRQLLIGEALLQLPVKKLKDAPPEVRKRFEELKRQPQIRLLDEMKGVGAAEVNRWIVENLRWLSQSRIPPSEELIELVAAQLRVHPEKRIRDNPRKPRERAIALRFLALDPKIRSKRIARISGVSLPTVLRWRKEPQFLQLLEILKADPRARIMCPESGQMWIERR